MTQPLGPVGTTIEDGRCAPGHAIRELIVRRVGDEFALSVLLDTAARWEPGVVAPAGVEVSRTELVLGRARPHEVLPADWATPVEHGTAGPGAEVWAVPDDDVRRWLVLGGPDDERAIAEWAWSSGQWAAPPLLQYLRSVDALHVLHRRWAAQRDAFVATSREADKVVGRVVEVIDRAPTVDEAREAAREVHLLQARQTGLVRIESRLRLTTTAARAAFANVRVLAQRAEGRPFTTEHEFALWFVAQLDDDIAWLHATRERAGHVVAVADQILRRGDQERESAARSRQERMNIGLTAVTAAILTALAAIQSFQLTLSVSSDVKIAVTAFLTMVTLVAGLTVLRMSRSSSRWPVMLQRIGIAGTVASAAAIVCTIVPDTDGVTTAWWSVIGFGTTLVLLLLSAMLPRRDQRLQE